ncbi:P-loop containing nucleoside triphosphate hydrolase protein [Piedraia hortae CBS 480.64]|uniref:P-loop containing nucleoside triphosphate hydrolase protein n=1 Tax=Piedraia hortae CBS 480.64 TaxID=1314780 RepID=A0A6A7BVS4_9PEZI|nr:P-loop containing nucleoside triphosphate hydrolase protein [Piedraia hortae CBS 480.64]
MSTISTIPKILLVLSGKGGVGKSSVASQLALTLYLQGHTVGLLDLDLTGPSIPRIFGLEEAKITTDDAGKWRPVVVSGGETEGGDHGVSRKGTLNGVHKEPPEGFSPNTPKVLPKLQITSLAHLLPTRSSAIIWRGPKKSAMIKQFLTDVSWSLDTKYLIIDTPPGTGDEHISLLENLQILRNRLQGVSAVVVTTPQEVSIMDVKKEINFCKMAGLEIGGVVENMSGFICPNCEECEDLFDKGGGERLAGEVGCNFLGRVPVEVEWGVLTEEGGVVDGFKKLRLRRVFEEVVGRSSF